MKTTMKTLLASAVALLLVACNDKPAETSPGTAASRFSTRSSTALFSTRRTSTRFCSISPTSGATACT